MKRLIIAGFLVLLTACSSFKLGGVVYCPQERDCQFVQHQHDVAK